jgi:predicted Zn-dependent protease
VRARGAAALVAVCAGLALACGGGSTGGGGKQVLLSTEYHDEMVGDENAKAIEAQMGVVDDPELRAYIEAIGKRMIPYAPQRAFDYSFNIVDQAAPNAFALPGGHIYVSRGLLTLANNEDELANVIGHEITHSAERHAAGQQEAARRLNPLSIGYMRYAQIASYGRDQERDADRGGQTMAARAGWDPMGMATFMQDLGNMERLTLGWSRLPGWFDSHPGSPERAATAAQRADTIEWKRMPPIAGDQEGFMRKMEGLVLGPDPKQGVFLEDRFLHPDMGFTFKVPKGWQPVNSPDAVGAVSPRGDAQFFLTFAAPGDDPEALARKFMEGPFSQQRGKVERILPMKIGPYEAFRVDGSVAGRGMTVRVQMTFVAFEGTVFQMNAVAPSSVFEKMQGRFQATARTFRAMTGEERDQVNIVKLAVVRARRGETLEALSIRTGNALPLPQTGVLNSLFLDTRLQEGQLVKIGRAEPYSPPRPTSDPSTPPSSAGTGQDAGGATTGS